MTRASEVARRLADEQPATPCVVASVEGMWAGSLRLTPSLYGGPSSAAWSRAWTDAGSWLCGQTADACWVVRGDAVSFVDIATLVPDPDPDPVAGLGNDPALNTVALQAAIDAVSFAEVATLQLGLLRGLPPLTDADMRARGHHVDDAACQECGTPVDTDQVELWRGRQRWSFRLCETCAAKADDGENLEAFMDVGL